MSWGKKINLLLRFITIRANKEAAEKIIPVKKRAHKAHYSSDPRILRARANIRDAYDTYQKSTTDDGREGYKAAKKCLEETYNQVIEEDMSNKIQEVIAAHANSKYGLSWRLINDITGRKSIGERSAEGRHT